jgi:hypothetical protein
MCSPDASERDAPPPCLATEPRGRHGDGSLAQPTVGPGGCSLGGVLLVEFSCKRRPATARVGRHCWRGIQMAGLSCQVFVELSITRILPVSAIRKQIYPARDPRYIRASG